VTSTCWKWILQLILNCRYELAALGLRCPIELFLRYDRKRLVPLSNNYSDMLLVDEGAASVFHISIGVMILTCKMENFDLKCWLHVYKRDSRSSGASDTGTKSHDCITLDAYSKLLKVSD